MARCDARAAAMFADGARAEVAALQSFINHPGLKAIRVSSVETYVDQALPADAIEVYRGPAENSDFLLKYVTVKTYDG